MDWENLLALVAAVALVGYLVYAPPCCAAPATSPRPWSRPPRSWPSPRSCSASRTARAGRSWSARPSSPTRSAPEQTRRWAAVARRYTEIDGEGAFWAVVGFAASVVVGVALRPLRQSAGLENVVVVYVIVVALTAAVGGRTAGLASSLSADLAYNYFFTTPYETLRIDSGEQVTTVVLLFVAGLVASLGGRATRRARVEAREEAEVLRMLNAVSLAAARNGIKADVVAAEWLRDLLNARTVQVVREGPEGDL